MHKGEGVVPKWEHDVTVRYLQGLLGRCANMLQRTLASHGREQKERDDLLRELASPLPGPKVLSDLMYGPAPAPRTHGAHLQVNDAPTPEEIAAAESLAAHGADRREREDRRAGGLMDRVAWLERAFASSEQRMDHHHKRVCELEDVAHTPGDANLSQRIDELQLLMAQDREFYKARYENVINSIDTTDRLLRGAEERLNKFIDDRMAGIEVDIDNLRKVQGNQLDELDEALLVHTTGHTQVAERLAQLERLHSEVLLREKASVGGYRTVLQELGRIGTSMREVRELAEATATRVRQLNSEQP